MKKLISSILLALLLLSLIAAAETTERVGQTPIDKSSLQQTVGVMSLTTESMGLSTKDLNSGLTPEQLVASLLGSGITVTGVQYGGADIAAGTFTGGSDSIGIESGVILSSGAVSNVVGPNKQSGTTTDNLKPGDADLKGLIPGYSIYDAAYLQFSFIPDSDQITFKYVFGSEEYNEWVDSSYNDVFGFFLNGQNVALIPGTSTPVSTNNVNLGSYPNYYRNNEGATINTELDGLTTILTVTAPVNKGQVNTIKLAIADAGDYALDSDVFIEGGSFMPVTDKYLAQVEGSLDVYLIENGAKHHFTSPEAFEWNGYSFDDIKTITSETLQNYPDGEDISISQPIIDKYHALGGAPIFGASLSEGEKTGDQDSAGIYCSYVNFQNGAIECFKKGPNNGKAYAIVGQFYTKWASMGYGKSVLGYPIGDMSEERTSSKNTPYKYQLFTNGTQLGALEWNLNTNQVYEVHGAIFAKWAEIGFASSVLGLPTGDEQDIASSKYGTVGRYGNFENGHIHWNQETGLSFVTYGALNECYNNIQGTQSDLGFPIMNQVKTIEGHDYCEFEKGCIKWNSNSGKYEPNYSPNINQKIDTRLKQKPQFPPYLLDPNYVGSTSVLWMQFSNFVFNTDLTKKYDELYNNGLYYYNLRTSCLFYAKKSLSNNDISSAEKFVQKADKMQKLSYMSFSAANDVFLGNIDSAELFAKFVKDESETILSVLSASSGVTIPSTAIKVSQVLTPLYIATDYWKDIQIEGVDQAKKNAIIAIFIQVTIHNMDFDDLNGKTVKEFIKDPINNISSEVLRQQLKDAAVETGVIVSEKTLDFMINSYREIMSSNVFLSSSETIIVGSPVELQVYDSKGEVTGIVNGAIKEEISNSIYDKDSETVLIHMANDTYRYEVIGIDNGTYDLEIVHSENMKDQKIILKDVPISINSRHSYKVEWENGAKVDKTVTKDEDLIPLQSIKNLQSTNSTTWINWTWNNPTDSYFNHTEIYFNGTFQTNISAEFFNATDLESETSYTISTRTVDISGNVNETWINSTATTLKTPIVVEAGSDQTVEEGTTVNFEGNFTASGSHTYSYHWDFGDGTAEDSSLITSHIYADDGAYTVNLTVTDEEGDFGNDTLLVTVNNAMPVVDSGSNFEVTAGDSVSFTGTFSDSGWLDTHTAEWNFGEGTFEAGSISEENESPASTGTVSGSFSYFDAGEYTITLNITDDDGGIGQDQAIVTVRPITATVNFDPDTLNLGSGGNWITAYIELPQGYSASNIDIGSVLLNGVVPSVSDSKYSFVTNENEYLADLDTDGISERMLKFNREEVEGILEAGDQVTVTFTGKVEYDNGISSGMASFEGSDVIKVTEKDSKNDKTK